MNITEGATALDMNVESVAALNLNTNIDTTQNATLDSQQQEETKDQSMSNISMENANYLQTLEEASESKDKSEDNDIPNFEVDSIEKVEPALFSDDEGVSSVNTEETEEENLKMFESEFRTVSGGLKSGSPTSKCMIFFPLRSNSFAFRKIVRCVCDSND